MKKFTFLFVVIFSLLLNTTAQNYQTVNSGRIASFEFSNSHGFIRVDSVSFNGDSIFIPFRSIQHEGEYCFTIEGAHWIGDRIIIRENGFNLFVNNDYDTIYINTAANSGNSWTAYHRSGDMTILATLLSHDTMHFLGLQDSVKIIGFQVYNSDMIPVNHYINDYTLKISKNHGFVRALNFSVFPDLMSSPFVQFEGLVELDISGIDDPIAGIQDFNWMDIYDFQPGDEIHITHYTSFWWAPQSIEDINLIQRYLDRNDYVDSIIYTVERIQSRNYSVGGDTTFTFIHDTISEVIRPNPTFDLLPGEPIIDSSFSKFDSFAYMLKIKTGGHLAKTIPEMSYWLGTSSDTCWHIHIIDGCFSDHDYYKGLGGPYHYCQLWGTEKRELVYYKKGDEEWGTPLVIVGNDEVHKNYGISIFPNPASAWIIVSSNPESLPFTIGFYDLQGRLIKEVIVNERQRQIGLQDFRKGMYLYRMFNNSGFVGTGKLLIE